MILRIVTWPDPLLNVASAPVALGDILSPEIQQLIDDMLETMESSNGVGLAAIQVGKPFRIIVANVGYGPEVYINPKIQLSLPRDRKVFMEEGCLSLPGISEKVLRYTRVTVYCQDRKGRSRVIDTDKFDDNSIITKELRAQMLQHESEHLDGITMASNWGTTKREMMRKKMKKYAKR